MSSLKAIWANDYFRTGVYLCTCYVLTNAFSFPLDYFDYIIVIYILSLHKVDESTAIVYAMLFGLAYDMLYHIYLGLGVLLFMFLNFIKVQAFNMIDLNKINYKLLFPLFIMLLYLLLTLLFHGYAGAAYWQSFVVYFIADLVALILIRLIIGGRRAIWSS